jgi:hypothetical protein
MLEAFAAGEVPLSAQSASAAEAEALAADLAADAEAAAGVSRTAAQWGTLLIFVVPFAQLLSDGTSALAVSSFLEVLISSAFFAQAFWLLQNRRAHRVEDEVQAAIAANVPYAADTGFAALAARVSAAALCGAAATTMLDHSADELPCIFSAGALVFWLAARLLERGQVAGFRLGLVWCAVLFAAPPSVTHVLPRADLVNTNVLGALAMAAALALWRGRHRDEWEAHLERLRRDEERHLAPGQEPDGPQDVVPPEYLHAEQRRKKAVWARRAERRTNLGPMILIADLALVLVGYRTAAAISLRTGAGPQTAANTAHQQSVQTLLLGAVTVVALLALAALARRHGSGGVVGLQVVLVVLAVTGTLLVSTDYWGLSQGSNQPSPAVTQPGGRSYCSGGQCFGGAS